MYVIMFVCACQGVVVRVETHCQPFVFCVLNKTLSLIRGCFFLSFFAIEGKNQSRTITKTVPNDSFFTFFSPPDRKFCYNNSNSCLYSMYVSRSCVDPCTCNHTLLVLCSMFKHALRCPRLAIIWLMNTKYSIIIWL